ncbi:MAG: hypothetical protein HY928_18140 [Elusimicrobia bacterium]|nr:hypothetical protein [Elusimicrobiota bacterium]
MSVKVPKAVYSERALAIAARTFSRRAEVFVEETKTHWVLTLEPRAKEALAALEGDFLNEALSQECRFLTAEFNETIASLQETQALLAARGGEAPAAPVKPDAALEKEAAALMAAVRKGGKS